MRVEREVRIEAGDKKKGMTAIELISILAQVPDEVVPKVEIGMNGRIKAIKVKIVVSPV